MINDKIKEIMQRSEERKDRLFKGERGDTIDKIDSDALAEVTNLLKQQTQESVRENNKKKRIRPAAPSAEEKQE